MKLAPSLVLRVCFALLVALVTFGAVRNLPAIRERPLLETAPAAPARQPLRFVIVAPQYDHPYWARIRQGAQDAAHRLAISLEFTGPRRAGIEDQVALIDQATAAQVDGILTRGVADPRLVRAVARAVDRGIPVITLDADLAEGQARRLTYVGSDNYAAGRLLAGELVRRTGGRAAVGIVRGDLDPEEQDLRLQGIRDGIAGTPGVRIVAVERSEMNRTIAGQKVLKIAAEHPEVNVLVGTTALDGVGIAQSVSALQVRDRVLVMGWDVVSDTEEQLARGGIQAVVAQAPEEMGRRGVAILEGYLRRDERPSGPSILPVSLRSGGGAP